MPSSCGRALNVSKNHCSNRRGLPGSIRALVGTVYYIITKAFNSKIKSILEAHASCLTHMVERSIFQKDRT